MKRKNSPQFDDLIKNSKVASALLNYFARNPVNDTEEGELLLSEFENKKNSGKNEFVRFENDINYEYLSEIVSFSGDNEAYLKAVRGSSFVIEFDRFFVSFDLLSLCSAAGFNESKTRDFLTKQGFTIPKSRTEDAKLDEGANYLRDIRSRKGKDEFRPPRPSGDDILGR